MAMLIRMSFSKYYNCYKIHGRNDPNIETWNLLCTNNQNFSIKYLISFFFFLETVDVLYISLR